MLELEGWPRGATHALVHGAVRQSARLPPDQNVNRDAFQAAALRKVSSVAATLSAALANVPENAAYGLIAMAPLGLAFGPAAMAMAILGAVVSNAVGSLLGAGRLAAGPRSSLALLTAGLIANLTNGPLAQGDWGPWPILLSVGLALMGAGLLQCCFGALGLGNLVKFTPYPVRLGLTCGIGLLLLTVALPVMLGQRFGTSILNADWQAHWGGAVVGLCALLGCWMASRNASRIPPVLLGLGVATLLHWLLSQFAQGFGPGFWGPTLGEPRLPWVETATLLGAVEVVVQRMDPEVAALLAVYAVTVSLLCSMDTLITSSIVDGTLKTRRSANRELVAQGVANMATSLVGGHAASPSVTRSLGLVTQGGGSRHIVVQYAAAMLALLVAAPQLLGSLPECALGGILVLQGLQLVAPALWNSPRTVFRQRHLMNEAGRSEVRTLAVNWAVALAVSLSAVVWGVGAAVLIGATCAVLLFVRSNIRDVVRHVATAETRRSLKVRPAPVGEALRHHGHRIVVLELEGSLFFGTADALQHRLELLPTAVDSVIVDLRQVQDIDVTAARILVEAAAEWNAAGRYLVFAEWSAEDSRRQLLQAVTSDDSPHALHFANDVDLGLEEAEERLIERLGLRGRLDETLALSATLLFQGLSATHCAEVAAEMRKLEFASGMTLFKPGDPGDGLYVTVRGEVGLRLPGSSRRLASFAAGVTIGEMAVLTHATRSAEAVAESDVTAYFLPTLAFDRLLRDRPELAAHLLTNMVMHLSDRVRALTGDLAHWVSRSASKQAAPDPGIRRLADSADLAEG